MFVPLLIIGAVGAVAHFEPCAGVDPNLNHLHQWCCCLALTRLYGAADSDCLIMRTAASGSPAWRVLAAVVPVLFSMARGGGGVLGRVRRQKGGDSRRVGKVFVRACIDHTYTAWNSLLPKLARSSELLMNSPANPVLRLATQGGSSCSRQRDQARRSFCSSVEGH